MKNIIRIAALAAVSGVALVATPVFAKDPCEFGRTIEFSPDLKGRQAINDVAVKYLVGSPGVQEQLAKAPPECKQFVVAESLRISGLVPDAQMKPNTVIKIAIPTSYTPPAATQPPAAPPATTTSTAPAGGGAMLDAEISAIKAELAQLRQKNTAVPFSQWSVEDKAAMEQIVARLVDLKAAKVVADTNNARQKAEAAQKKVAEKAEAARLSAQGAAQDREKTSGFLTTVTAAEKRVSEMASAVAQKVEAMIGVQGLVAGDRSKTEAAATRAETAAEKAEAARLAAEAANEWGWPEYVTFILAFLGAAGVIYLLWHQKKLATKKDLDELNDAFDNSVKAQLDVIIPDDLEDKLLALADGKEHLVRLTIEGKTTVVTLTKCPKDMVTVTGIESQTQPVRIDRLRSTLLRAIGDGRLKA